MSAPVTPALATGDEDLVPDLTWLKADLLDHATALGLDVDESMTKAEILAAIQAA